MEVMIVIRLMFEIEKGLVIIMVRIVLIKVIKIRLIVMVVGIILE